MPLVYRVPILSGDTYGAIPTSSFTLKMQTLCNSDLISVWRLASGKKFFFYKMTSVFLLFSKVKYSLVFT